MSQTTAPDSALEWSQRAHVISMEQAALGAMLMLQDAAITQGMLRLSSRCFLIRAHAIIFGAIANLEKKRQMPQSKLRLIDTLSVQAELFSAGRIEEIGALDYLATCVEACPCAANIDHYIDHVLRFSKLRYIDLLNRMSTQRASHPGTDPDQLIVASQNALAEIKKQGWANVRELLEPNK